MVDCEQSKIHFKIIVMSKVSFGVAIEAAKQGKRIAREGWNGKGMFVFQRPEDDLSHDMIINTVKSLPASVKAFFAETPNSAVNEETKNHLLASKVKFTAYLCMYAADGSIVNGWLASQTDVLSEDWIVLD
jgi:hypothetical protein